MNSFDFSPQGMFTMNNAVPIVALTVGAFLALLGAGFAYDNLFAAHMWVLSSRWPQARSCCCANSNLRRLPRPRQMPLLPNISMKFIKYGTVATTFWGVVGFLVGVVIALQLAFPDLNFGPWFNFGRMRPLHTSAVIFAFGGNALLCTSFYVVQRTCRARLFGGDLAWFVFWATSSSLSSLPQAICSASRRARNMRSRNGMSTCG